MHIDRVVDGKIIEHWGQADTVGMLQQLGVVPLPILQLLKIGTVALTILCLLSFPFTSADSSIRLFDSILLIAGIILTFVTWMRKP